MTQTSKERQVLCIESQFLGHRSRRSWLVVFVSVSIQNTPFKYHGTVTLINVDGRVAPRHMTFSRRLPQKALTLVFRDHNGPVTVW